MDVVVADGLAKRRGSAEVLGGVDLRVPEGSVTAVIGANGAGKTTLLRILVGLQRPTAGTCTVLGCAPDRWQPADRQRVAYIAQRPAFLAGVRVGDLLRVAADLHPRWDASAAARSLERFAIGPRLAVATLSPGMRALLALAIALATGPDLLVLDEPAAGLDPVMRRRYLQALLDGATGERRTVLLASQDLALVERLCDRIALLHRGRIQVAGPLDGVLADQHRLRVGGGPSLRPTLGAVAGVRRLEAVGGRGFVLTGTATADDVRSIEGVGAVQDEPLTLEELFWSYVADPGEI